MASSADSPEYARQRRQLALWRELLPGIEEFLVKTLSQEKLSSAAEERRQYFVERLDILRLPPSLPPRVGKRLSVELLEESEESCGTPSDLVPELSAMVPDGSESGRKMSEVEKDFAAEQRKISRNMLASVSTDKDVEETTESDSAKGVKVYDDIDPSESTKTQETNDDDDDDDINALYEIPVARQQPTPDDSLSQPADLSSMATLGSMDDIDDEVLGTPSSEWQPPPLPPRTKKKESESAESRVSTNSLDGKAQPPELPFRPPLPRRNEVYARSEKSDKSEKSEKSDVSDGDSTSYESFDENENDNELKSKINVKLPKRSKKKPKTSSKLLSSKTRSSSGWEINKPFKLLDNILISGEMLHKGKLSWNRRVVALSNGCMALYKPDKEMRPVFVIPLSGCTASVGESLGRKGFEMKINLMNGESYIFAVDFKEWANQWCEQINNTAQGIPMPSCQQHLARTFSGGSENSTFGSKVNLSNSNSNLSVSSEGMESDDSSKPRLRANKVMRMGSFAYRATQFFENLGKKSTSKRKTSSLSSPIEGTDYKLRDGIQEESSMSSTSTGVAVSPSSEAASPVFDDSIRHSSVFASDSAQLPAVPSTPPPPVPANIKYQGYLNIFSSFNKRRWGQRWCLVRENMFECYKTQTSVLCELNFLLKNCVLRQALAETNSALSLMLLENNREKITVEPPTKEDLCQWLKVLMSETATEKVPDGLEEYFAEGDDNKVEDMTSGLEAEYSDIVGVSVMKSWEVGSLAILGKNQEKKAEDSAEKGDDSIKETEVEEDSAEPDTLDAETEAAVAEKYLYSAVIKRPSTATLVQLGEEGDRNSEEEDANDGERREEKKMPCFTDNLTVYNANKNTTDSGFYSVKEANSDSDSGSELKTDSASPVLENGPAGLSEEGPSLPKCNNSGEGISVCVSGGVQTSMHTPEEEDEEESALEKTMTSDDFKDAADPGQENVNLAGTETKTDPVVFSSHNYENGTQEVNCDTEKEVCVADCLKDKDGTNVVLSAEKAVQSGNGESQSQVIGSEDGQQQEKPKRRKKKGKNKKNKQKQQEQDVTCPENNAQNTLDNCAFSTNSSQLKQDNTNPESTANPSGSNSTVTHTGRESLVEPSNHRNSAEEEKQSQGSVSVPSTSAVSSAAGAEERVTGGPEEDEGITELRDRIGRMREKLVQIKRKRIAVRDKRVRAFSPEERSVCDKEYLVLESECKDTAAVIHNLEEELKAATAASSNRS